MKIRTEIQIEDDEVDVADKTTKIRRVCQEMNFTYVLLKNFSQLMLGICFIVFCICGWYVLKPMTTTSDSVRTVTKLKERLEHAEKRLAKIEEIKKQMELFSLQKEETKFLTKCHHRKCYCKRKRHT